MVNLTDYEHLIRIYIHQGYIVSGVYMQTARIEIDLNALRHNYHQMKALAPRSKVVAVVKGNAYGHGSVVVAKALPEADAFAVARIEEAVELREAGITQPILLLEGCFCPEDLQAAARLSFHTVIHSAEQLHDLQTTTLSQPVSVWLKIDTGMHRIGVTPENVSEYVDALVQTNKIKGHVNFVSHFYMADELNCSITHQQLDRFIAATKAYPGDKSLSNSAGVLYWNDAHFDWVRPGIALYGISPRVDSHGAAEGLQPVMTLKTCLIAVREHKAGDTVGYGGHWTAEKDTNIGVIAMGYGDGYPRLAPNGTPVLVNGVKAPISGRVSMDMMTIDLGPDSTAKVGDEVVLWGKNLPAEEIANHIGTIAYELVIKITNRVKRIIIN